MKLFIKLLVGILVGIALYTVYGLLTFQPDEAKPFVFSDPVLPPEIIAEQQEAAASSLSATEEQQKKMAMDEAQKAFDTYQGYLSNATPQIKDTWADINDVISNWEMPAYFLTGPNPQLNNERSFEKLRIDTANTIAVDASMKSPKCSSKTPAASIIVGSTGPDILGCDVLRDTTGLKSEADVVFIGGPENDTITDVVGNRIVNAGSGDDTISLAAGRSIIVLDAAWGRDTLTIDCTGARVNDNEVPKGFPIPWSSKTTNFIVLGSGVEPKDVSWTGNVLTNRTTGDSLTVSDNCFTVVPSGQ